MPAELCLCNFCTKFGERERCRGKLRLILVTVVGEIDHPLWLCRWMGSLLPVKFYGGRPSSGEVYLAYLLCLSGEYVSFLLAARAFWVLYGGQEIYEVDTSGNAAQHDAWKDAGDTADYIGLGIGQNLKVALSADEKMAYSADAAESWSYPATLTRGTFAKVKFDRNTAGRGWVPVDLPTAALTDAEKQGIVNNYLSGAGAGNYAPGTVHGNYTDFRGDALPVSVYGTTDGGATWTETVVGYLAQTLPVRIAGSQYETRFFDSATNGYCDHAAYGVVCTWETTGDVPTPGEQPCMSGAVVTINQSGSARDIASRWRDPGGPAMIQQYASCSGAWDKDRMGWYEPEFRSILVAPEHNGSDYYVAVTTRYKPQTYSESVQQGFGGATVYVSPFLGVRPTAAQWPWTTATVIYRCTGASWVIGGSDLAAASEGLSETLEVDPSQTDRLYAISDWWRVWKLGWNAQSVEDVSPVDWWDIGNMLDLAVADDGTVLVPLVYWDGADYVFGVWRSTNQGATWSFTDMSAESEDVWNESCTIAVDSDGTVGVMLQSGKLAYSTDSGATWSYTTSIGKAAGWVNDIEAS